MEFSELFTQGAREVLPLARRKGLVTYLDHDGDYFHLAGDHAGLRSAVHRLMRGLIDCFDAGFVVFTSALEPRADGTARAPGTAGEVTFAYAGREGIFLSLVADLHGREVPGPTPLPDADGNPAWVVSEVPGGLDSVGRRLRRLGWQVAEFSQLDAALHRLDQDRRSGQALPLLLVVAESSGAELGLLERMSRALPATRVVLAVVAGSPALEARSGSPVDIRPLPLSPLDLEHITRHVDALTSTAESRETAPSPLYAHDVRQVLAVDDSIVNQLVARGQLELLGYDVVVAAHGAQALSVCRDQPPDTVLMDIDMPELHGLQTTRHLREWQEMGIVPPFPIVAATGGDDMDRRRAQCQAAGMDGFLAKPLDLGMLAREIRRVLPERPAEAPEAAA